MYVWVRYDLLQELRDVRSAAAGPRERFCVIGELSRHDARLLVPRLTAVIPGSIMLHTKATTISLTQIL